MNKSYTQFSQKQNKCFRYSLFRIFMQNRHKEAIYSIIAYCLINRESICLYDQNNANQFSRIIIIFSNRHMQSRSFGRQLTNLAEQEQLRAKRNYSFLHNDRPKDLKLPHSQNHSLHLPSVNLPEIKPTLSDPQMVPEYFDSNLSYLRSLQSAKPSNYLEDHKTVAQRDHKTATQRDLKSVTESARAKLIDWLAELHLKYKMFPQTIFTVVAYIDSYLGCKAVHLAELQLVGITALLIAAKFEQTYQVPRISQLLAACGGQYTAKQLLKMEADMLHAFNFELIVNSSFKFYEPLARKAQLSTKNVYLGQYILELALVKPKFLRYPPSLIASATIYLVKKIRKTESPWDQNLQKLINYKESQLKSCGKQLCTLLQQAPSLENCNAIKKKYSLPAFHEVAKIKIERKK